MKWAARMILVLAIVITAAFLTWAVVRIVKAVDFNINCEQYIKRAVEASTVDRAMEELEKAIQYAEEHELTEGIVSIFLKQPANDVGFWYNNMVDAHRELSNLPKDASSLEKTNVLMKLRESLSDESKSGAKVNVPSGISIYPANKAYFWWGLLSFIFMCIAWPCTVRAYDEWG